MEVKASLKHLKIAPRKTRLVVDLIRGLEVNKAINQLKFLNKKSAQAILKLVNSAVANAINNFDLDKDNLIIKEIRVEDARILKRWLPRAHGRATIIRKRMSHIYITLAEIVESEKKKVKEKKIEAPIKLDDLSKQSKKDSETTDRNLGKDKEIKKDNKTSFAKKVFRRKAG